MKSLVNSSKTDHLAEFTPIGVDELLKEFMSGRSEMTIQAYRQDLASFQLYTECSSVEEACSLLTSLDNGRANYLVLRFKNRLIEQGLAPATINRRLSAVRSLSKLARTVGITSWTLEISNVEAMTYKDTRGPGLPAFKRIIRLAANQRKSAKALRDVAILRLMFDLALRRQEVIDLDISSLDLEGNRLQIMGKGRKEKEWLSLPEASTEALINWLEARGEITSDALFVNFSHNHATKRISPKGMYTLIRSLGKKAGVRVHPHSLRHCSITEACNVAQANGYDLEEVMDFSRHKSVEVLMLYRDRIRDRQGSIASLVSESCR